jgi:hypothetical protein
MATAISSAAVAIAALAPKLVHWPPASADFVAN